MASVYETQTQATVSEPPNAPERRTIPQVARREVWSGDLILLSGTAALVWVILLVLAAPGSYDYALSPLQRLAFYAGLGAVCWPLGHTLAAALLQFVRVRSPVALGLTAIGAGAYLAANLCAVSIALEELFIPLSPDELSTGAIYLLCAATTIPHVGLLYFVAWQRAKLKLSGPHGPVTAAPEPAPAIAIESATDTAPRPAQAPAAPEPLPGAAPHVRFLDRLPPEAGRDLVCIMGMGHYLEVVTASGSTTVLMRFADAIAELGAIGLRVHRSYWVAHRHVAGLERRNGRTRIRLTSGDELPVSRTYMDAVCAAEASRAAANGRSPRGGRLPH